MHYEDGYRRGPPGTGLVEEDKHELNTANHIL
jgi:hypothetical protein